MQKNKILFPFFVLLSILGGTLFLINYESKVFSENKMEVALLIIVAYVFVTLLMFLRYNKQTMMKLGALRAVVLFLISYVIVHFQIYLDVALSICPQEALLKYSSASSVVKSAIISLLGLLSFLFAYSIIPNNYQKHTRLTIYTIHVPTNAFKVLSFISLIWLLYCGKGFYFSMTYGSVDLVGTRLAYAQLLFSLFMNTTLLLCMRDCEGKITSISEFVKRVGGLFNLTFILFIFATFSSGDRGPALFAMVSYFVAAVVARGKKVKFSWFFVMLFIGSIFLSLLGIIRSAGETDNMSGQLTNAYYDLKEGESLIPATRELAGSVRTLDVAVDVVPEQFPHSYGVFQLSYIIETIPFVSHFFPSLMTTDGFNRSTSFLTYVINGDNSASGVGTTCIADAYIDFGAFGVLLMMFFWGVLVKRSELLFSVPLSSLSLFQISIYFVTISVAVYVPRSAILFSLKSAVWLFIFTLLVALVPNRNNEKKDIVFAQ